MEAILNNDERAYTVHGLRLALEGIPDDAKVRIEDADTSWTIPKFTVRYNAKDNELWFHPCDYKDMEV